MISYLLFLILSLFFCLSCETPPEKPAPWGPWSNPILVNPFDLPGLPYGSYMNPLYVENNGETLYFILSLWDPYDVFLMKVKLIAE